ncbi:carnosine N-methyltransferase [Triangularia verruculosa]|uniref:Carnosine N-methyltransferase n=1 Tax=Triangularia verruculosa TaxID=2587418 RepID=A0AAN6X8U3_9PEZI|nr:carnosine N-methyltransferase [Triangularia verruculosa]
MWTNFCLFIATTWLLGLGAFAGSQAAEQQSQRYSPIFEVHQAILTVNENASLPIRPVTERHLEENEGLFQRMSRKHGRWNEHHPRYRLLEALRGFSSYAELQRADLDRLKGLYSRASKKQKALLEREVAYSKRFANVDDLILKNQELCDAIVNHGLAFYQVDQAELDQHIKEGTAAGRSADKVSVSQALKHLVRDWSAEGVNERGAAFPCILKALSDIASLGADQGRPLRIALPGAGLGRLGHEVAKLPRFEVTNNEWSMYQNLVYRFLENSSSSSLYPFIDSWSHHRTGSNMLRAVTFPDVPPNPRAVVLVEGDFTTVFSDSTARFDVVVTHFFIDTARNIMTYFDTISRILKPGGYWINFGPLLYGTAPFIQLSLEDIVTVAEVMGFEFLDVPEGCGAVWLPGKKVWGMEAGYGFDYRALTKNAYDAQFWVARRA